MFLFLAHLFFTHVHPQGVPYQVIGFYIILTQLQDELPLQVSKPEWNQQYPRDLPAVGLV